MQKIEFLTNLEEIIDRLKSKMIVDLFNVGFSNPGTAFDYGKIKPLLFQSKSQFDQIMKDDKLNLFLKRIVGINIYEENNLSNLTSILIPSHIANILNHEISAKFFSFHNSLLDLLNIAKSLLSNDIISRSHEENLNNGILIFEIKIESNGLSTSSYIKILSALGDIVKTLEKVHKLDEEDPSIVLLDSGSDTNVGLETKVEIAKSIFQIFKEIWDFITSFRFYKSKQRNQALLDSLSVRKEILKAVEEGTISETEGKEYVHIIKSRTDELIGMKVLPRVLMINQQVDNTKMLDEYNMKVLEEKNQA
jgi:hypothetical protein